MVKKIASASIERAFRVLCAVATLSAAPAGAISFQYSGFASIVAGQSFGGCVKDSTTSDYYNGFCTRFIADWAHAGVYTPSLSLRPDSKLGLQGTVNLLSNLSATAQVVGRGTNGTTADLEWAYLSYSPSPSWTVQVGRKRIPLFFYSSTQDVGYTYEWVRLPPDVYGWDAVNYNGASAGYNSQLLGWGVQAELFWGNERANKSAYSRLSFDEAKDVEWHNIVGTDVQVQRGWLTLRAAYIVSDYRQITHATDAADVQPSGTTSGRQVIYGVAANVDVDHWLVRSEYSVFDRSSVISKAKCWFIGTGYRLGDFTPMLTVSSYYEVTNFPSNYTAPSWSTWSASLRYELGSSSDLKLQVDRFLDGRNTFAGTADVVAIDYDVVF
jgi:hypothetical protein